MITISARVFTAIPLRRSLSLASILCVLSCGSVSLAQNHSGHFHSPGFGGVHHGGMHYGNAVGGFQTNGPAIYGGPGLVQQFGGGGAYNGPYQYNYGGFNASAPLGGFNANAPLGGVSFGNGFGTATYSQRNFGVTTYGVSRGGFGGINCGPNYGIGYGSPVIFSTPIYNYSPSVFGYGTGVFSPNFPSGNYISNGYIGFVPSGGYNFGGYSGWPNATCINPYFAGAGIAPTVLMLNMNLNMQPVVPATSSYSLIDPRMIDVLAPAPDQNAVNFNGVEVPPIPQPPENGNQPVPDAPQLPIPTDGVPVLNEFNAIPRDEKISSLAEKIHSLRYQASGDDAFHKSDYATADVFYATAIKTAPDRRAPYLRMAMVRIALADFPNAASYLKTGLTMESDPSRPWCTAEELYGQKVAERARSHGGPLWNWLAERPLSADRLLLAGTFQKLRGYNKTADEMLALASHQGTEAILVTEVMQLAATDIGPRAVADDLEQLVEQASARNESSAGSSRDALTRSRVEQAGGIFLRGHDVAARKDDAVAPPPLSIPAPDAGADETPAPLEIPSPEQN
ncbi:MAG: hypothetical protein H7Z17_12640 [Fuerstia sp.]|nr:hypothetical protein [Fuerstiella sp.]